MSCISERLCIFLLLLGSQSWIMIGEDREESKCGMTEIIFQEWVENHSHECLDHGQQNVSMLMRCFISSIHTTVVPDSQQNVFEFLKKEYFGYKLYSRWPASLVAFWNNALLEQYSFIFHHMLIDDGGTFLAVQQCNMVPCHKVHLYFLITVL